ncbi:phage tail tube protein [Maritalea sp.]|uniref:phage tail tube protein n=1 Tax=Maritalea sp. TaxID=2003361 RepID=UPI003EF8A072
MSDFTPPAGGLILVKIGDGADPEVFSFDCLINSERGINFSSSGNDYTVPDCADLTKPAWRQLIVDAIQASISGGGKLYAPSVKPWFNWLISGATKNIRYEIVLPGVEGGGYFEMKAKLTAFDVTATTNQPSEGSVTIESHGPIAWVDAA